jgi:hypothetical protein
MEPISRITKAVMTVDEAVAADRKYFDENSDEDEYIREFVPGEFGVVKLPEIPPGFRYATHVSVTLRVRRPAGRTLSAIDDDLRGEQLKRLIAR